MKTEKRNERTAHKSKLKKKAAKKPLTKKPSTKLLASKIIQAFIQSTKNPILTKVTGKVSSNNKGLIKVFRKANAIATHIAFP